MLLIRKEKEKLVIQIAHEGKTTREIANQVHMSKILVSLFVKRQVTIQQKMMIFWRRKNKSMMKMKMREKKIRFITNEINQ